MKIIFATTSEWHDKFLLPIAEELDKLGYETEQLRGADWEIDNPNDFVILSYQIDTVRVRNSKATILMEHAVSPVKSMCLHPQVGLADYVLVQGKVFSKWLLQCHPRVKQIKCGWHRIEKLNSMEDTHADLISKYNLNPKEPIIVYCPTWDTAVKDIHCGTMDEAFPILSQMNIPNLLTIPHPSCPYGHQHKGEKNVFFELDSYDFIAGCDLIIGDTSSLLVESTIKNKPIIQLNKWNHLDAFITWYAEGWELEEYKELYGLFQLGQIVNIDKEAISKAIDFALSHPDVFKLNRDYWKSIAFYNLGSSLNTTVKGIVQIINK